VSLDPDTLRPIVEAALREDLGKAGDLTTDAVVPPDRRTTGRIVARQDLIVSGVDVARMVFAILDPELTFTPHARDGEALSAGVPVVTILGRSRSILRGERTALNFLMRMCGIATAARDAVAEVRGTGACILDTRKTVPGLRALDKYAVACGGARNHRGGLFDAIMIKDTHLEAVDSIRDAVAAALGTGLPPERVTVEVRTLEQLREAIAAGAGRALLDNMDRARMREAVELAGGRIVLEASGGLRPGDLRSVAETGVDALSLGYLTHSTPAADLALEMEPLP
jgi:nicotinate-nucleotide pyrophosphorylase (carboxylating)